MLKASQKPGRSNLERQLSTSRYSRGLSLIELLAVLSIAAILINVAAPSFASAVMNARIAVGLNQLTQSIHYGRSEAVKRARPVSICARGTNTACNTENDWSKGWVVYTDANSDGTAGVLDTADTVLRIVELDPEALDITASAVIGTGSNAAVKHIRFNSRGFANWAAGTFSICKDANTDKAKSIIVVGPGSVRSTSASADIAAKDAFDMDIDCE